MSAFEYFFAFLGLILGLALANVAGGFGRLWRARSAGAVGWCTPMVALLVLMRIVTLWISTWSELQTVAITQISLFTALGLALPYVLVSTLMFPDDSREWPDLDAYYMKHARFLLVVLAIPPFVGLVGNPLISDEIRSAWDWVRHLSLLVAPLIVMLIWRCLWLHKVILTLMVLDEIRILVFG